MKMKIWIALASFVMSFALLTTNVAAQDFSGDWTLDEEASELPQQQFGVWSNLSIEETDDGLVVTRTREAQQGPTEQVETINLQGATVENPWFQNNTRQTRAEWDYSDIVVTNTMSFTNQQGQSNTFSTTERYTLNDDETVLTIEYTSPGFGGGGEPTTSTFVYNKSTE